MKKQDLPGYSESAKLNPLFCRDSHTKILKQLSHLPVSVKVLKCGPNLDTTGIFALRFGINFWKRYSRVFFFNSFFSDFYYVSMLINNNKKMAALSCSINPPLDSLAFLSENVLSIFALRATQDPYGVCHS